MELTDIIESFPDYLETKDQVYRSFIFQPEKLSINSELDVNTTESEFYGSFYQTENFNSFTNNLISPILNIKSLQFNRCSIPNAVTSIPNNECLFIYKRVEAIDNEPDFEKYSLTSSMRFIRLLRTDIYNQNDPVLFDLSKNPTDFGFNTVFDGYQGLVNALNKAAINDPVQSFVPSIPLEQYYVPNDLQFQYDSVSNKIVILPQQGFLEDASGVKTPNVYYVEVGYDDPLIPQFLSELQAFMIPYGYNDSWTDLYRPLNVRLGFPWNGLLPQENTDIYPTIVLLRMFPLPDYYGSPWSPKRLQYYAQSFGNLVYTQNVFLYCDVVGGSSRDTLANLPLLAVVPMATAQLGISSYEAMLSNPLTKITKSITEMSIVMKTDTGSPFWLPNSASVNLEIIFAY